MSPTLVPAFVQRALFANIPTPDQLLNLVDQHQLGPLVYVSFATGLTDYLALRHVLRQGGKAHLAPAAHASGQNHKATALIEHLKQKRHVLLNLEPAERRTDRDAEEALLENILRQVPNVTFVPVAFVWRRKRRREELLPSAEQLTAGVLSKMASPLRGVWDLVLGDPYQPKGLRKWILLLRQYTNSTIVADETIPAANELSAGQLRRKLLMAIHQQKKGVVGAAIPSRALLQDQVMRHPELSQVAQQVAKDQGKSVASVLVDARSILNEIASRYSYFVLEILGWGLSKLFSTIFEEITLNEQQLEELRTINRSGPVVYVPCHKSYIDFLVLSYVLFRRGISCPHVAAGINLNRFPFGHLLSGGGAFFIRRSFKGNLLYHEVLKRYLEALFTNQLSMEFFVEGTRSRNGKLAPPKYGMLKMLVDLSAENKIPKTTTVVPVSIAYDRVTEEQAHQRELQGGKKSEESFWNVLKSTRVIFKSFGKVHLRFGKPIVLAKHLETALGEATHSLDSRKLETQKLAFEICHRINASTPVTSVGIAATLVLSRRSGTISKPNLDTELASLGKDLSAAVPCEMSPELSKDWARAVRRGLARLLEAKLVERKVDPSGALYFSWANKQRVAGHYYKNSAIHALLLPAIRQITKGHTEEILELRSLLEFEFFFSEKDAFLKSILAIPSTLSYPRYASVLDDVLGSIELGARALLRPTSNLAVPKKAWLADLLKFSRAEVEIDSRIRPESANTQSLQAFLSLSLHRKWLVPVQPSAVGDEGVASGELLRLHANKAELQAVLDRVLTFRERCADHS